MLSEEEVASFIRSATTACSDDPGDESLICGSTTDDLTASENAGFEITLVDGTRFQVVVTMIEEGQ